MSYIHANYSKINNNMKSILLILVAAMLLFTGTVTAKASSNQYGPVQEGETLWDIAYKIRPSNVSRLRMMRAIHLRNSSSFRSNNINLLKEGSVLEIPTNAKEVSQFIRGTAPDTSVSKKGQEELEEVRSELADVIDELKQSRATLKGLKDRSSNFSTEEQEKYQQKISSITEKYNASQKKIAKLEKENAQIKEAAPTEANKALKKELATMAAQLKTSQEKITTLTEEKSKLLKSNDLAESEKLASTSKKLEDTRIQLDKLKMQNALLKEQAANTDATGKNQDANNKKVSETIAALNSDIGQLRGRIKELEELEKLKDAHINELQKSLDHATTVIKEQADVNKKMYARLNEMDKKTLSGENPEMVSTVLPAIQPDSILTPSESKQAGVGSPLSDTVRNVSPKFWLLLTLAGLLFVLALLWRSLSGRNDDDVEDDMEDVDDLLIKR